jgi:hypothetical protein
MKPDNFRFSHTMRMVTACFSALIAAAALIQGCRVQAGNPQSSKPVKPGTVTIALADAPVDELSQIFVTVDAIAFAPSGTGACLREPNRGCANSALYEYELTGQTEVDLLSLSDGRTQILPFTQDLSSGTYEGIRLFLSGSSKVEGILKSDGSRVEIEFPNGPFGRKEFTIIEEFEVQEGTDNEIIIHVDLRRSLQRKPDGKFILMPMTNVVPSRIAARLYGAVGDSAISRICAYNLAGKRRQAEYPKSPQGRLPYDPRPPFPSSPHGEPHHPQFPAGHLHAGLPPDWQPVLPNSPQPPSRGSKSPEAQMDKTSSCDLADAVSDPKNGTYDLRYLMPVSYILRSFKSDGSFTDTAVSVPLNAREERELAL